MSERMLVTAFSAENLQFQKKQKKKTCSFKAFLLNTLLTQMELQCLTPKSDETKQKQKMGNDNVLLFLKCCAVMEIQYGL